MLIKMPVTNEFQQLWIPSESIRELELLKEDDGGFNPIFIIEVLYMQLPEQHKITKFKFDTEEAAIQAVNDILEQFETDQTIDPMIRVGIKTEKGAGFMGIRASTVESVGVLAKQPNPDLFVVRVNCRSKDTELFFETLEDANKAVIEIMDICEEST